MKNELIEEYLAAVRDVCENPDTTLVKGDIDQMFINLPDELKTQALAAVMRYGADLMERADAGELTREDAEPFLN
jgi:hypothetical protein